MPCGSSSFSSARFPRSIWPAPSCSRICTGRLSARGIEFRLAEAHGEVRDALRKIGLDREHGPLESGQTVDAVLSEWQARS